MIDSPLGVPGIATVLAPAVRRILAPNPSIMTGAGTNTYLVGTERVAVIDPGPDDPAHLDAIVAAAPGPISWIVVTHAHPDHWPGAAPLAARTGAAVLAWMARGEFAPTQLLGDGEIVPVPGAQLTALHTPGHAPDHLCLWLEQERTLFTGDHVMHGSTVVLFPPEGDVRLYLQQLERVRALEAAVLAPAHGQLFADPTAAITAIIEHRGARERKVLAALQAAGSAVTVDELLHGVYDDIDPGRLLIARGSLWAHLRKLVDEGAATTTGYDDLEGGRWESTGPRGAVD